MLLWLYQGRFNRYMFNDRINWCLFSWHFGVLALGFDIHSPAQVKTSANLCVGFHVDCVPFTKKQQCLQGYSLPFFLDVGETEISCFSCGWTGKVFQRHFRLCATAVARRWRGNLFHASLNVGIHWHPLGNRQVTARRGSTVVTVAQTVGSRTSSQIENFVDWTGRILVFPTAADTLHHRKHSNTFPCKIDMNRLWQAYSTSGPRAGFSYSAHLLLKLNSPGMASLTTALTTVKSSPIFCCRKIIKKSRIMPFCHF